MASDSSNPNDNNPTDMPRQPRRGSVTSSAFANLFRSNSTSQGTTTTGIPGPITTAAMNDQRRRLSLSTLGLSGSSPSSASTPFARRASLSTNNSDSIDENAIEEEEDDVGPRTVPNTPFTRRMSFGAQAAMRSVRAPGTSPAGSNGRPSPPHARRNTLYGLPPQLPLSPQPVGPAKTWGRSSLSKASSTQEPKAVSDVVSSSTAARADQGFNWSEQLRSRAESTLASGARPPFSFTSGLGASPPRANPVATGNGAGSGGLPSANAARHHGRAQSVSDMPAPPSQAPKARQPQKPDHIQERILKGDFYMD